MLLLAVFLFQSGSVAWAEDKVILRSGPPVRGAIESVSPNQITILADGTSQDVPVAQVRYVMFENEPTVLRQIRDAVSKGQYAQAERYLERVKDKELKRDLIQTDVAFFRALCESRQALESGKGTKVAATAMIGFAKAHPKSYHFYDAAEVLGDLAVALGRFDAATKYYGQLEKSPVKATQLRGALRTADALRAQGSKQLPAAVARYEAVINGAREHTEEKNTALLGKAICQAELGQAEEGIASIEQVILAADPDQKILMAQAYNALGVCYQAAGKPKDALLAHLHVDLLFRDDAIQHAEALRNLAKLWAELGYPDRASEAQSREPVVR